MQTTTTITKQHDSNHAFDNESVLKVLFKNSLPIVMLMIANSLYTLIDALLAVKYVSVDNGFDYNGGDVIGAVFPLAQLLLAFSMIYIVGSGLYYSKRLGQKKYDSAERGIGQAMMLSVVMGVILWFVILGISGPYSNYVIKNSNSFNVAGVNQTAAAHAGRNYLIIISLALIPLSITNIFTRALRAEGKGSAAALIPMLPIPINITLDILFMGTLGMGISGAALATFLASLLTMFFSFSYVKHQQKRKNTYISFEFSNWKPRKATIMVILAFGMTSFIRRIGSGVVVMVLSINITQLGNIDVIDATNLDPALFPQWAAMFNTMARTLTFQVKVSLGTAQAAAMLCAYYYGTKNYHRIFQTLVWGFLFIFISQLILIPILAGSSGGLLQLFGVDKYQYNAEGVLIPGSSDAFKVYRMAYLWSLFYIFINAIVLLPIMFYASSRNNKAAAIHVLIVTTILISFAYIASASVSATGERITFFWVMCIGAILASSITMTLFYFQFKLTKEILLNQIKKEKEIVNDSKELKEQFESENTILLS